MRKQRKHYTPEEKVAILRRHLLENEPISKLCDELGVQPTVSTGGRRISSGAGGEGGDQLRAVPRVARHHHQQVLRLAGSLRQSERGHGWVPRDFWLEEREKQAIIGFHRKNRPTSEPA